MKELKSIDISQFLPHRAPFLMVDVILSLDDEHVTTSFKIKENCIFNDNGFLNEAGLIENAAQTCSSIVGKSYFEEGEKTGRETKLIGFISAIKKVVVYECPPINQQILTKANLVSRFDSDGYSICAISCSSFLGAKELLSCEMNLFIQQVK